MVTVRNGELKALEFIGVKAAHAQLVRVTAQRQREFAAVIA
jgi:hypothetical protein